MNKIKILSENMINLVSAGEVVSRPSSVVKELVENSIDANSSKIEIEIKNGGKKLIRVSDNGDGIRKSDVKTAFLKHATSKIYNESDLEKITSLGFRGEALSSICAVSKVEIFTSNLDDKTGTRYIINGGKEVLFSDCAPTKGTSICVSDLFYNTPARIKFLKKDYSEGNYISDIVDHLCLSHPKISFKFIKEGKITFCTPGDGKLSSVISRIFSVDFFKSLIAVDYKWNNIFINGFISDPFLHCSSMKIQNFFINGRWVKNKIISNAIESALKDEYQNSKVSSIIYLNLPFEAIDVNVHPEKIEVRFENEKIIFDCIYNAIKNSILMRKNRLINKLKENDQTIENDSNKKSFDRTNSTIPLNRKSASIYEQTMNVFESLKEKTSFNDDIIIPKKESIIEKKVLNDNSIIDKNNNLKINSNIIASEKYENNIISDKFLEKKLKIIGEIFGCFFIIEYSDEILLVDKHAAHERIIFEKLNNEKRDKASQMLMSSITVNLSRNEYDVIIDNLNLLNELGYFLEDFGYGKVLVRGIPPYIESSDIKNSILEISDSLIKNKMNINELKKVYAQIACKSSIKAGKISTNEEIKFLIKKLIELNLSNCPHGRPIYINIKKDEIYKKFLRK